VLRPLRTHLTALSKAKLENKSREAEAVRVAELKEKRKEEGLASNSSPDWLTRALSKKKALKKQRTYAVRSQVRVTKKPTDSEPAQIFNGEIQVPSIYISSQDGETGVNPEIAPDNSDSTTRRERRSNLRKWTFSSTYDETEIRVAKSYVAIMLSVLSHDERKVNHDKPFGQTLGSRSLRCMAIRQIPVQIEQEEMDQQSLNAQDRYDPTENLYQYLDDLNLPKDNGVCFQAQILRAHATRLVCNAIWSQQLHFATLSHYITEYGFAAQMNALPEMDDIKSVAILALQPDWKKKNCLQDPLFQTLVNRLNLVDGSSQASRPKNVRYVRMFNTLLDNSTIPIEWLGTTSFSKHWQEIIIHASSQLEQYYDAIPYIVKIVRLGCGIEPMSSSQSYTLNYVPTLNLAASNCDSCRQNHGSLLGQRSQLQSAFTKSLSCLFIILPSLVLVGCEEYTNHALSSSLESQRYKPNLLAIRSLLQSCTSEILEYKHLNLIKTDKSTRDIYATRSTIVLFSTLLTILTAPLPINYTDIDPDTIVRHLLWIEGAFPSQSQAANITEQLVSICRASSQMSGASPETFLQYLIGTLSSAKSLSRRSRIYLQRIWVMTEKKMDPTMQPGESESNAETKVHDGSSHSIPQQQNPRRDLTHCSIRNPQLDSNLTWKSSLSTEINQNCRWDSVIDEWIALTPARPSWTMNKILMATPKLDIDEESSDIDELDTSFKSQDETIVEMEQVPYEKIESSPSIIHNAFGKKYTGRISDLIPSSSPRPESPAAVRYPSAKLKQTNPPRPALREVPPNLKGLSSRKRVYSSDSESDGIEPSKFARLPLNRRVGMPLSTYRPAKRSDLALRQVSKVGMVTGKNKAALGMPMCPWIGAEDELS
jgi:hypothetical protein